MSWLKDHIYSTLQLKKQSLTQALVALCNEATRKYFWIRAKCFFKILGFSYQEDKKKTLVPIQHRINFLLEKSDETSIAR